MTRAGFSRRDAVALALALIPLAAALSLTLASSPLPYLDYWPAIAALFDAHGAFLPSGLLHYGNEHPLFLPSAIFALNTKLSGGSDLVLGAVAVALAACGVLATWWSSRDATAPLAAVALTFAASCLLTTPHASHNLMFGMSGCAWWLANACAAWAVVAMARGRAIVAVALCVAAMASYGTGLAAVPAVLVAGWVSRVPVRRLIVSGAVLGLAVAWMVLAYQRPPGSPETTLDLVVVVRGMALLAGRLAATAPDVAVVVGALVLVSGAGAAVASLLERDGRTSAAAGSITYAAAAMAMTAIGRGEFGDEGMMASRYASIGAWAWIGLASWGAMRPAVSSAWAPLVIAAALLSQVTGTPVLDGLRQAEREQDELANAIAFDVAEQAPRFQPGLVPTMRAIGHYPFNRRYTADCGLRATRPDLDPAWPADAGGLIEGWLPPWGPARRPAGWFRAARPIDCLVILDATGEVVGAAVRGFRRHDIGTKLGLMRYDWGWQGVAAGGVAPYRAAVRFTGERALRVLPGTLAAP